MINLTSRERKSLLFVAVVLVLATTFQYLLPHQLKSDQYDYSLQDSLFKALSADTISRPQVHPEKTKIRERRTRVSKKLTEKSININTADGSALERLPGIGPKTAANILEYRRDNGPFKSLEELKKVKRIGPKTLQKISPFLFISSDSVKNH